VRVTRLLALAFMKMASLITIGRRTALVWPIHTMRGLLPVRRHA